jgi:hypothetical protein
MVLGGAMVTIHAKCAIDAIFVPVPFVFLVLPEIVMPG